MGWRDRLRTALATETAGSDTAECAHVKTANCAKTPPRDGEGEVSAQLAVLAEGYFPEKAAAAPTPADQSAAPSPDTLPTPTRAGLARRNGTAFEHYCAVCGAWACWGYGADIAASKWFCGMHRPVNSMARGVPVQAEEAEARRRVDAEQERGNHV